MSTLSLIALLSYIVAILNFELGIVILSVVGFSTDLVFDSQITKVLSSQFLQLRQSFKFKIQISRNGVNRQKQW